MSPQLKVFRAHRALAWFYALVGIGMYLAIALPMGRLFDITLLPMLLGLTAIVAVHFFTARACRQGKPGGRIASIVIACLMLLGFPIGTLIGVYLLSNTWNAWGQPLEGAANVGRLL